MTIDGDGHFQLVRMVKALRDGEMDRSSPAPSRMAGRTLSNSRVVKESSGCP